MYYLNDCVRRFEKQNQLFDTHYGHTLVLLQETSTVHKRHTELTAIYQNAMTLSMSQNNQQIYSVKE